MTKQNIAIIGGIIFIAVLGVIAFILLRPEAIPLPADFDNQTGCEAANFYWWDNACNLEPEPIKPEATIKPQVILRGDMMLTSYLPLNIKQGHIATFDIFYEGKMVGETTWERVREDKTKMTRSKSIPEVAMGMFYRYEAITTIIHCPDSLKPKEIKYEGTVDDVLFQINTIVDYETNRLTTISERGGSTFEFSHEMLPNSTNKIDIQNLDVNWKFDFLVPEEYLKYFPFAIEVVEKTTVTVPAGTFDVLVIKYTGPFMFTEKEFIYYITLDGKIIKTSFFTHNIPELDSPIISKLRLE